jgi:hypothetical protein
MKTNFSPGYLLSILLSLLLGVVFLFSAYTKLFPVEPFEYTFIDTGVAGWQTAPFVARLLIGLELFCGVLLILHFQIRRFTIPLVASLLIFFCIYLLGIISIKGNSGNCGCFGEYLSMTPLQAIIKNVGLLLMCGLVYALTTPFRYPYARVLGVLMLIVSLAMPFILNVVDLQNSKNIQPEAVNYELPLELLYHSKNPVNIPPSIDLTHGKYIIAYLSLTCPHCRIAAQKIHTLHKTDPHIPFYLVLNGKKEAYQPYVETYGLADIPHQLFLGPEEYIKMSGTSLPEILWVNNSIVEKKSNHFQLTQEQIEIWLAATTQPKP